MRPMRWGNRARKQTESEATLKASTLGIFLKEVGFGWYIIGKVGLRRGKGEQGGGVKPLLG